MPDSSERKHRWYLFVGLPMVILVWLCVLIAVGGFYHEYSKFKAMLLTTAIVFLIQFLVLDPIKFIIQAYISTFLKSKQFHYGLPRAKTEDDEIRFFKMRIKWAKARLRYNWRHRDEQLNTVYRNIAQDLWFYALYFVTLLILVIILIEPLQHQYSEGLKKTLTEVRFNKKAIEEVETITEIYDFLQTVVIDKLHADIRKDEFDDNDFGWTRHEIGKMLGVIRLTQVRWEKKMVGLDKPKFQKLDFMPNWKLPYRQLHYRDKYWRIYEPWVYNVTKNWLLMSRRKGYLSKYPHDEGYMALLARGVKDSGEILKYLKTEHWLDDFTAALFIDFTVYSVDSNIFGVIQLVVECLPFHHVIMYARVDSSILIYRWNHKWYWLILFIYLLLLVKLAKTLVLKAWYGEHGIKFFTIWNIFDCIIILSNIIIFVLIYAREEMVADLMENFEAAQKIHFVDFRPAVYLTKVIEFFLAVLVCIATFRLWKILMFARAFRLFVRTLHLGGVDLFWGLLNIMLFLIALTISSYVINGSSRTLSHTPISFVHILSFSLGYSERVNPLEETERKDNALVLIIYALVMFSITLVLTNMLVTLVCIHFSQAKEEERQRGEPTITFCQFLKVEYGYLIEPFREIRRKLQRKIRKSITVQLSEKIQAKMQKAEDSPALKEEKHVNILRRTRTLADILFTQTEILNRRLKTLGFNMDDSTDEENNDQRSKDKQKK